jgi:hypothetical protein
LIAALLMLLFLSTRGWAHEYAAAHVDGRDTKIDASSEVTAASPDNVALPRVRRTNALTGDARVVLDMASGTLPGDVDDYVRATARNAAAWKKLATKQGHFADELSALRVELAPHGDKHFDSQLSLRSLAQVDEVITSKHRLLMVQSGALTSLSPQGRITADPAGETPTSYNWPIRHHAATMPALAAAANEPTTDCGGLRSTRGKPAAVLPAQHSKPG